MLHANVVFARYLRAVTVLVFLPMTAHAEVADPTRTHALVLASMLALVPLAGWMHREAAKWWDSDDLPRRHRGPTTPPPPLYAVRGGPGQPWQDPREFFAEFRRYDRDSELASAPSSLR